MLPLEAPTLNRTVEAFAYVLKPHLRGPDGDGGEERVKHDKEGSAHVLMVIQHNLFRPQAKGIVRDSVLVIKWLPGIAILN